VYTPFCLGYKQKRINSGAEVPTLQEFTHKIYIDAIFAFHLELKEEDFGYVISLTINHYTSNYERDSAFEIFLVSHIGWIIFRVNILDTGRYRLLSKMELVAFIPSKF